MQRSFERKRPVWFVEPRFSALRWWTGPDPHLTFDFSEADIAVNRLLSQSRVSPMINYEAKFWLW